jgi:hypothetical protein
MTTLPTLSLLDTLAALSGAERAVVAHARACVRCYASPSRLAQFGAHAWVMLRPEDCTVDDACTPGVALAAAHEDAMAAFDGARRMSGVYRFPLFAEQRVPSRVPARAGAPAPA